MKKIDQGEIQLISRNSNLSSEQIKSLLKENVYHDKQSWLKFLQFFCISIGVGFLTVGIIFFFAYNWDNLHKFAKLGIIQLLIIATVLLALFLKIKENLKNIILTGAALLFGVLFAVFGQIYQTGANAYDFFLVWTICITIWVISINFYALWLIFIALINTTFILYTEQVATSLKEIDFCFILFFINSLFLIGFIIKSKYCKNDLVPNWFLTILMLIAVFFSTVFVMMYIDHYNFENNSIYIIMLITVILALIGGIYFGYQSKNLFYLAIIPLSFLTMITTLILNSNKEEAAFLIVSSLIMVSIGLLSAKLIHLQKKWKNEK